MQKLTVQGLAQLVDRLLNRSFPVVAVEGELAQLQIPGSGHAYLVLKEGEATLQCVIWKSDWLNQRHKPKVGERVICSGRVGAYASQGRYQLYANRVEPATGQGELDKKLAAIRARLDADGLLDPRRKRPLPRFPRVVGVATSLGGAALQDFLRLSQERWPAARILVAGCTVQGIDAAASVVRALDLLYEDGRADVIVVTRGGGSRLDLMPFQDEGVARWIATAPVPVVSAVGHEVDTTMADLVADAVAPTPSAAAVKVLQDGPALAQRVDEAVQAMERSVRRLLRRRGDRLKDLSLRLRHPAGRLVDQRRRRDELEERLHAAIRRRLLRDHERATSLRARLESLSPYAVLDRGYAIVRGPLGVVRAPSDVDPGDPLDVRVSGGTLAAVVR